MTCRTVFVTYLPYSDGIDIDALAELDVDDMDEESVDVPELEVSLTPVETDLGHMVSVGHETTFDVSVGDEVYVVMLVCGSQMDGHTEFVLCKVYSDVDEAQVYAERLSDMESDEEMEEELGDSYNPTMTPVVAIVIESEVLP